MFSAVFIREGRVILWNLTVSLLAEQDLLWSGSIVCSANLEAKSGGTVQRKISAQKVKGKRLKWIRWTFLHWKGMHSLDTSGKYKMPVFSLSSLFLQTDQLSGSPWGWDLKASAPADLRHFQPQCSSRGNQQVTGPIWTVTELLLPVVSHECQGTVLVPSQNWVTDTKAGKFQGSGVLPAQTVSGEK